MQPLRIDEFDVKILRALQDDARHTNQELAELVGLSASQCSRRRRALEDAGIVEGYQARLSPEALGFAMMAFVHVRFATHATSNHDILLRQIDGIPEVVEAYSLTGSWDYILKVVVQSLARFEQIINTTFSSPECNLQVQSSFVLRRLKQSNRLPLPRPDAAGP